MGAAVDYDSFRLSRIYAQGWNAARRLPSNARTDPKTIAKLNPHKSELARIRWTDGFLQALE